MYSNNIFFSDITFEIVSLLVLLIINVNNFLKIRRIYTCKKKVKGEHIILTSSINSYAILFLIVGVNYLLLKVSVLLKIIFIASAFFWSTLHFKRKIEIFENGLLINQSLFFSNEDIAFQINADHTCVYIYINLEEFAKVTFSLNDSDNVRLINLLSNNYKLISNPKSN